MKYHEITMAGKMWLQTVSSNPAWTAADKGRIIYNTTVNKTYIGTTISVLTVTPKPLKKSFPFYGPGEI